MLEPRGELHIRYEPDSKRMFITVAALRKHCAERQIGYKSFLSQLEKKNILLGIINKRMCKGMKIISPAVRVLEIDTTRDDTLHMDDCLTVVPEQSTDANREDQLQH